MSARALAISLLWLACAWLPAPAVASPGELELPGVEPVVAAAARWAVAIRVERESESFPVPRPRGKSAVRLPQDLVDYYRRPPGPTTGMLLDRRGNILTTHYNVSGKVKSIEVILPGNVRRAAKLIASDRSDDLALIRLEDPPADLEVPEVKWAEPEDLQVGKVVLVVGRSPEPERPTATFGIISALGRNGGRTFQTDAELNYGNVGGPITGLDGAVVGLAGFVGHKYPFNLWGLNSGIGFGTTAQTIRSVLPKLLAGETVLPPERPFLGVQMSNNAMGGQGGGVLISEVTSDSAAEKGGLRAQDVVLLFDGQKVEDFLDLRRQINRRHPGDEALLKVRRGQEELEIKVRLGRKPE